MQPGGADDRFVSSALRTKAGRTDTANTIRDAKTVQVACVQASGGRTGRFWKLRIGGHLHRKTGLFWW